MSQQVRSGVVGLGMGMNRSNQVVDTDGAKLVAVADLDENKCKVAEEKFSCDSHTDALEMFDRNDIDVAFIMLPSGLHAKLGVEAANRGKHVITTKPMDVNLANCDALIQACEQNQVQLLVDFQERYGNKNREIQYAVQNGLLGEVIHCELSMKWYRPDSYYVGWHGTWEFDGGGSIMNQGVHYVDLMLWFMGGVKRVIGAHYDVFAHENCETEDLATAILEFNNGAIGTVYTTTTFPKEAETVSMINIHGDKGAVGLGPDVWTFADGEPDISLPDHPVNVVDDAVRAIREGRMPAVSGQEGRRSVELNMAIYESARTGRSVSL